jgi:hypothetical protein
MGHREFNRATAELALLAREDKVLDFARLSDAIYGVKNNWEYEEDDYMEEKKVLQNLMLVIIKLKKKTISFADEPGEFESTLYDGNKLIKDIIKEHHPDLKNSTDEYEVEIQGMLEVLDAESDDDELGDDIQERHHQLVREAKAHAKRHNNLKAAQEYSLLYRFMVNSASKNFKREWESFREGMIEMNRNLEHSHGPIAEKDLENILEK